MHAPEVPTGGDGITNGQHGGRGEHVSAACCGGGPGLSGRAAQPVHSPGSSLPVTVREQCEAPDGKRFDDGLVLHRKIWEALFGGVLVFFGLTH